MADEVTVRVSIRVKKDELEYVSNPQSYSADLTGKKGPTPGAISVATAGTDVSFAQLTTPGYVWMINLDDTNFVEWGIKEPATGLFYPIGILRPGQPTLFEFSPNLLEEYTGAGTGTSAATNLFHMKANGAACNVRVDAFEA